MDLYPVASTKGSFAGFASAQVDLCRLKHHIFQSLVLRTPPSSPGGEPPTDAPRTSATPGRQVDRGGHSGRRASPVSSSFGVQLLSPLPVSMRGSTQKDRPDRLHAPEDLFISIAKSRRLEQHRRVHV